MNHLLPVGLAPGVDAWFTGRRVGGPRPAVGRAGNLSHRRPHLPATLAADRAAFCAAMGLDVGDLHLMHQVHGAEVATVDAETPRGVELAEVDALVTATPGRALGVLVADCVPLLLAAAGGPVAAVHAGRRGLVAGIVPATLERLAAAGAPAVTLAAAIGPAIGGCCYEVPAGMRDEVGHDHPAAVGVTTAGTPSLDLPAAVTAQLRDAGIERIERVGGCTRCDPDARFFSHRADPDAGRQAGVVVLQERGRAAA